MKIKNNIDFNIAITIMMITLFSVSIFQTFQITSLKNNYTTKPAQASGNTDSIIPESLNNLPDMVGGC